MKRLVTGWTLAAALLFVMAPPAGADRPREVGPFVDTFEDVNPCTGEVHTVTIAAMFSVHFHGDTRVAHGERTISTSSGYAGEGTSSFVLNRQIEMFRQTDMLGNDAGDRIRANGVFVLDLRTDTVRVESFDLTCLGS